MSASQMVASCNAVNNLLEVKISESIGQPTTRCQIVGTSLTTGIALNDTVFVSLGTADSNGKVFTGIIKNISKEYPPGRVSIDCEDVLVRAMDAYLIPYPTAYELTSRVGGYASELLVADILQGAFLADTNLGTGGAATPYTRYYYNTSSFNFAVGTDSTTPGYVAEKMSRYDACKQIGDLIDFRLWADFNGALHFKRRPHYASPLSPTNDYVPGPNITSQVPSFLRFSQANGNLLSVKYSVSTEQMRNQILVEGVDGSDQRMKYLYQTTAEKMPGLERRSLPSAGDRFYPYFDTSQTQRSYASDFYQGTLIGTNWLVSPDSQTVLQSIPPSKESSNNLVKTAAFNMDKINRVIQTAQIETPGDYRIHALLSNDGSNGTLSSIASISNDFDVLGIMPEIDTSSNPWFVVGAETMWNSKDYKQSLTLMR